MAYESTPARIAIRDKLVNLFVQVSVEGVVTHEQIAKVIGARTTSPDALKHSAFKIAAEEHGVAFENIRGTGYRRLAAGDIHRVGHHVRHSIRGKARRGSRKMIAVMAANPNSMSNTERLRAHAEIGLMGMIQMAAGRGAAARAYRAAEAADNDRQKPPSHGEIAMAVLSAVHAR